LLGGCEDGHGRHHDQNFVREHGEIVSGSTSSHSDGTSLDGSSPAT
jgi:hypothetical protein